MSGDEDTLECMALFLEQSPSVQEKVHIGSAFAPAQEVSQGVRLGDDCAAIPDGDGWLLFAAEGMLESFVAEDPWFAGYSAVMVNLSDVAAMGGRPMAVVDVLWSSEKARTDEIWAGMRAASRAYGVPIVGGHTTRTKSQGTSLAAAVLGKARNLLTSFDARPGDELLMVVDLRGAWRGDKPFWNASVDAPGERLRGDLELLPQLAETGWCLAAKDISNGGIVGTLAMLLHCSKVGAELCIDALPRPDACDLMRWLLTFPSFGYLLSVAPENRSAVEGLFAQRDITCARIGCITAEPSLTLGFGSARTAFRSFAESVRHAKYL